MDFLGIRQLEYLFLEAHQHGDKITFDSQSRRCQYCSLDREIAVEYQKLKVLFIGTKVTVTHAIEKTFVIIRPRHCGEFYSFQ